MKLLRWALGAVTGLWALYSAYPLVMITLYKVHVGGEVPADAQRFVPLMEATAWWQLLVWAVSVILLLVAAWRLLRGGKAFAPFALSVVISAAHWWYMVSGPVYTKVFTAQELMADYYILAGEVVVGLLIWWSERSKSTAAAA